MISDTPAPPAAAPAVPSACRLIRSCCELREVPVASEIRMYVCADIVALWQQTEDQAGPDQPPPYWAVPWAGGQALARYILDNAGVVTGRRVLDLGSGSGLVAIAAAKAGAAEVLASEIDPVAAAAIALNARANGVPPPQLAGDVLDGDGEGAGVVLAGDLWYTRALAARVLGLMERAAARGAVVLTGDIGRPAFPDERFQLLAVTDVPVAAGLEDADIRSAMVATLPPGPRPRPPAPPSPAGPATTAPP